MQRVKLDPTLRKFLRVGLFGFGAMAIMSAIVNGVAAVQLIDTAEEQSLGISRGEFLMMYAPIFLVGVGMIYGGYRLKK